MSKYLSNAIAKNPNKVFPNLIILGSCHTTSGEYIDLDGKVTLTQLQTIINNNLTWEHLEIEPKERYFHFDLDSVHMPCTSLQMLKNYVTMLVAINSHLFIEYSK